MTTMPDVLKIIEIQEPGMVPGERAYVPDPYWGEPDWHAAARCDGRSYCGTAETIQRRPGESDSDFWDRAARIAARLEQNRDYSLLI